MLKSIKRLLLVLASSMFVFASLGGSAAAVTGSDWRAGNIMDDGVFYDASTMSTSAIQSFLNGKVPSCDTWGNKASEYGGGTRAQYGTSRGYPPPYTCLKDYSQNGKSAAQIIKDAANSYNINPKVLIVLLQKEQSLVTDDWPWSSQYRSATGYGCPDTAPCDAEYYGFTNQVTKAAYQFRRYATYPSQYRYKPYQSNFIQYNPNAGCGGTNVYIENLATAGLYNYTPYQPNASALTNLYGSGDSCGAYGNRNFWRLFNDWFGATQSSPFFSYENKVYIEGANNTYYYVPDPDTLSAYGLGYTINSIRAVGSSYLSSKTSAGNLPRIARFNSGAIYAFDKGRIHHFRTEADYFRYGYSFGDEAVLPSGISWNYIPSTPMTDILKQSNGPEVYLVEGGSKRHIVNWDTFTKSGSPTYSSRASSTLVSNYASTIPTGTPVIGDGNIVVSENTNTYYYADGNELYAIDPSAFGDWGVSVGFRTTSQYISGITKHTSPEVGRLLKSSDGKLYIVDSGRKLLVSSAVLSETGLNNASFLLVPGSLLSKFNNANMTKVVIQNGASPVYELRAGELFHIYSEDDLKGLGYNWTNVVRLKPGTISLFTNNGKKAFKRGKLLRASGAPSVYIIDGPQSKRHIPSEELMQQYGYPMSSVSVVPASALNGYSDDDPLSRFIADSQGVYWVVNLGYRHRLSPEVSANYGIESTDYIQLSQDIINRIPGGISMSRLFRATNSSRVYLADSGTKRWITSEAAFSGAGYKWADVRIMSPGFVDTVPNGNNIN